MPRRYLPNRQSKPSKRNVSPARPKLELLESRLLLYSQLGDQFVYSSRITYSFMPDGTSVGGVPSALFSTLNAKFPTATWEAEIEQAASIWENAANLNLALVSDGGEAEAVSGNQQDDSRFGDIRIGAVPLGPGTLAVTFLPPPANGGTDAGDILINSSINWQIGSNYDLMTVMAHEFGHALGLGDVSNPNYSSDVMYGTYNGIKTTLTADDTAGIQAVDGVRQFDAYNINGDRNLTYFTAANITSKIGANTQIAIPSLDITTGGDSEWFYLTVPSSTTGTMKVTVQSSNLSSLSPKLQVYTSSLGLVGQAGTVDSMGATVSVSTAVTAGQGYYIKVLAAGGFGAIGGYGLLVNMGSQSQSPIPPPNTVVAQQPDGGGGSLNNAISIIRPADASGGANVVVSPLTFVSIGGLTGWAETYVASPAIPGMPATSGNPVGYPVQAPASPGQQPGVSDSAPITPSPAPSPKAVTRRTRFVQARLAKETTRHAGRHLVQQHKSENLPRITNE